MIPDPSLSINEGAIAVLGWQSCTDKSSFTHAILQALCREYQFDLDTPFEKYPKKIHDIILHGTNGKEVKVFYKGQRGEGVYDVAFEGLIKNVERRYKETGSETMKAEYETFMNITPCSACHGQRLKPGALAVTVGEKNIAEVTSMSIGKLQNFLEELVLGETQMLIGGQILKEIRARIKFLMDVGLDYLTLARATGTLSGGEAQRIRLATQIGSGLVGVAYILDEPSIGLHQRDNDKLLATLKHLRDLGNTLIVVEHDEDTMMEADYIVDIGPGAGEHGGEVVAVGNAKEIMKSGVQVGGTQGAASAASNEPVKYSDFLHLPHGLDGYFDYDQALKAAQAQDKPLFIDFTGHGCVNCREMEQSVWSDPRVLEMLKNDYIIVALYVDDKTKLPAEEVYVSEYDGKKKNTLGKKNTDFQIKQFESNAQPNYILLDSRKGNEKVLKPHVLQPARGYNKDREILARRFERV